MKFPVRRRGFAQDFRILMQPIEVGTISRVKADIEDRPVSAEPCFDCRAEVGDALPR
jgi:hypothetical protein